MEEIWVSKEAEVSVEEWEEVSEEGSDADSDSDDHMFMITNPLNLLLRRFSQKNKKIILEDEMKVLKEDMKR